MPTSPSLPNCSAILVAAGNSNRMGMDKLSWPLVRIPVLRRTLDALLAARSISSVVVVCPPERFEILGLAGAAKPVIRTDGGKDRQDSVACGLDVIDPEALLVAVHDGARALISPEDIDRCVIAAMEHHAASLARRVVETIKRSNSDDFSVESVSRENLWCMETPQVFEVPLLKAAYAAVHAASLSVTDEVSALETLGIRVKLVESLHPNPKITTPADMALAEALVERQLQ